MKLDRRVHVSDIHDRIQNLLKDVGLTNRYDVQIGGGIEDKVLSGGEKKRLAFATEVLTLYLYRFVYLQTCLPLLISLTSLPPSTHFIEWKVRSMMHHFKEQ